MTERRGHRGGGQDAGRRHGVADMRGSRTADTLCRHVARVDLLRGSMQGAAFASSLGLLIGVQAANVSRVAGRPEVRAVAAVVRVERPACCAMKGGLAAHGFISRIDLFGLS